MIFVAERMLIYFMRAERALIFMLVTEIVVTEGLLYDARDREETPSSSGGYFLVHRILPAPPHRMDPEGYLAGVLYVCCYFVGYYMHASSRHV